MNPESNTDLLGVLTREGVLINASVRYPRFHKKLRAADLGLEPDRIDERLLSLGHKKLLPKEALADLALVESRTHSLVEKNTFPFLGGIGHFLPNAKLVDLQERLNSQEVCFRTACENFLRRYDETRRNALLDWRTAIEQLATNHYERETLYAQIEEAFPDREAIEKRFAFEVHLFQIAVPEDLGVELVTFAEQNEVRLARHEAARNDTEMEVQLDRVRRELLSSSAEDYRNSPGATRDLEAGLTGLRDHARDLAQQDARELVERFGQMGRRKLQLAG